MEHGDYRIQPVAALGEHWNGVSCTASGAWLGEVVFERSDEADLPTFHLVLPLLDDTGEFVPAPEDWPALVVERLAV